MVDNRSDLVKVVAAPVVGQRIYRDARGPIYDVSVADVRQAGHVDWPGSSSANDTSIPKSSEYLLIGASICMGNSLLIDPAQCPPLPPPPSDPREYTMTTSGHSCPIVKLPVERPMAPCSDLSYATTRSPLILAGCA